MLLHLSSVPIIRRRSSKRILQVLILRQRQQDWLEGALAARAACHLQTLLKREPGKLEID